MSRTGFTPRVMLEEQNPYGTYAASVESDGRVVYFYLNPLENPNQPSQGDATPALPAGAVWLRNLEPAPAETDRKAMTEGRAPVFRREACSHPEGEQPFLDEELDLVWFQEGNAAALFYRGELQALIPPWTGRDGYFGYSRAALAADVGTLPFPEEDAGLRERVQENLDFWTERTRPEHWAEYRDRMLAYYESGLGAHSRYFAVTDPEYPALAVVEFPRADGTVRYVTLGMSNQNQPGVELYVPDPSDRLRVEITLDTKEPTDTLPGILGRVAAYPWSRARFFDNGHLFEAGVNDPHANLLIKTIQPAEADLPDPAPDLDGYPLRLLRAVPIPADWVPVYRLKGAEHVFSKLTSAARAPS